MGIWDLLGESFDILKSNLSIFVLPILTAIAILVFIVCEVALAFFILGINVLGEAFPGISGILSSSGLIPFLVISAILVVLLIVCMLIISGAYVVIANQSKKKEIVSVKNALRKAYSRVWSLFGAGVIMFLMEIVPVLLVIGLPIYYLIVNPTAIASSTFVFAIIFVISVAWIIFTSILMYQAYVVVLLENKNALDAVNRSIEIGKNNIWEIFAALAITYIVSAVLSLLNIIPIIGYILYVLFVTPFVAMMPTIFYFDYVNSVDAKKKKLSKLGKILSVILLILILAVPIVLGAMLGIAMLNGA